MLGASLLALGLLVAIVVDDYEPVRLAPVFMWLAWFPLIAVHEAGHALAARSVGWQVDRFVVGFGRTIFCFEVYGVPCAIKMYPLGGHVSPAPLSMRWVRLKSAWVYAAGPGVEVLVVAGIAGLLGLDRLLTPGGSVGVIAAQSIALAASLSVLVNLVPRRFEAERGRGATDGLGILRSLTRPLRDYQLQVRDAHEARIREASSARAALDACERATEALGEDARLRTLMVAALRQHHLPAEQLDRATLPDRVRARLSRR